MKLLKTLLSSTIAFSITLVSANLPLHAQTNLGSDWYDCTTREQFTPQKADWCNQMQQMLNASYIFAPGGRATLRNGEFVDRTNQVYVGLDNRPGQVATGDLDGDGISDIVTLLTTNTGGSSGVYSHLVAGLQRGERVVPTVPITLGDRVQVQSVRIQDRKILVDVIVHGENDPRCCPTVRVQQVYRLGLMSADE
ncbi:FG-GAP repeat domain-containing protein [Leptolyngbya ohadii]|uniref:FG-GAP repeat domain-containing protein n=1 Tax=Leptolyngbya ohadii TaxID=1962290 RepID=UPI000B599413|nr:VCBS repeat-containing protein [Leptolyngbya ohadii]